MDIQTVREKISEAVNGDYCTVDDLLAAVLEEVLEHADPTDTPTKRLLVEAVLKDPEPLEEVVEKAEFGDLVNAIIGAGRWGDIFQEMVTTSDPEEIIDALRGTSMFPYSDRIRALVETLAAEGPDTRENILRDVLWESSSDREELVRVSIGEFLTESEMKNIAEYVLLELGLGKDDVKDILSEV